MFIDGPVVHLQGGVTPVPGESDQMVFSVVDVGGYLLNTDVHRPNVKCHTYFALILEKTQRKKTQNKLGI